MKFSLDGKKFGVKQNVANGETDNDTVFCYHQADDRIWAEYAGGAIVQGHLLGIINNLGHLEFVYHHINNQNHIKTGKCYSVPQINQDGIISLNETWQWTCDDFSEGVSELIEL